MSGSVRRLLFVAVVIGLLLFAWIPMSGTSSPRPEGPPDDERPPIIIGDGGSVDLTIQAPAGSSGEWQAVTPGNERQWRHDWPGGPRIAWFVVTLPNASNHQPNSPNCQDPNHQFRIKSFNLTFGGLGSGGTASVTLDAGQFRIDFTGAGASKASAHQLSSNGFLHFRKLKSIELATDTCKFYGNGAIKVRQNAQ